MVILINTKTLNNMINRNFGKIIDGKLEYAEYPLITQDGNKIFTNDASVYLQYGFKMVVVSGAGGSKFTLTEDDTTIYLTYIQDMEAIRALKLEDLETFNTSSQVDGFYISVDDDPEHNIAIWLNGYDRCKLEKGIIDWKEAGNSTYGLCIDNVGVIDINCDTILNMLKELEVYAVECFKATFLHKEAIKKLNTIKEIESYDFTVGYPEKITFTFK